MTIHEQYLIEQAAETVAKLRALTKAGSITIESASPIGEAMAMLKILSNALEARREPAL